MKAFVPLCLFSLEIVLGGVGCRRSQPPDVQARPTPPAQLLVFYDDKGELSERTPELSQAERDQIVSRMASESTEPIWFIRVKPSEHAERRGAVTVYLVPQGQTERIRKGTARYLWTRGQESGVSPPWEYIQISGPGRVFTQELTLPSASDLPLKRDEAALSQEELIRVSDFVRQPSNYQDAAVRCAPESEAERMIRQVQSLPLLRIREDDGKIHVTFGYFYSPGLGGGYELQLERASTGYRLENWALWLS